MKESRGQHLVEQSIDATVLNLLYALEKIGMLRARICELIDGIANSFQDLKSLLIIMIAVYQFARKSRRV